MKSKMLSQMKSFTLLIVLMFIGTLFFSQSVSATTYRMKIQSAFPHGDKSTDLLVEFAAAAKKRSNGDVRIKVFAAPEIVPTENLLSATKRGTVDMMHGAGVVWGMVIPVANVAFGLPGAFTVPDAISFEDSAHKIRDLFFEDGLIEILREEYAKQGLYLLDIHIYGPVPVTLSNKPINKCSDMKGMIVRSEGLNMKYQEAVGVKSMLIPGEEVYMALKTGVIDGAEWDISAITGMKWHEVAPYWLTGLENDQAVGDISVNLKKWNKLPADVQQTIKNAARDYYYATVKGYKEEITAAEALIKKGELHKVQLDQECLNKYSAMAVEIMDGEALKDGPTAKAIAIIKKWKGVN
jgi:TRAP-type C4-dicarboxylate transport system substrate-binding protein